MSEVWRRAAAMFVLVLVFAGALGAEEASFQGWLRSETEHFVFIYEPRDEAAVEELVTFADQVYERVASYFAHYPTRVHVIVNGRTDYANGYFTPLPNHMNLFVASPSTPALGAQTESWLKLLFTHELTHYVHLTYPRGVFGGLSRVFGELLQTGAMVFMPGWVVEGVATNLETAYTAGGRGRNAFFEMYYKAPIMDAELFSLRQAAYMSPYAPPGRIYVAGYMLVDHLRRTYGDEAFARIHEQFVKFPFLGPAPAIKKVTGESSRDVFKDMKAELAARFAPYQSLPSGRSLSPGVQGHYYLPVSTEQGLYLYRSIMYDVGAVVSMKPGSGREEVLFEARLFDPYSLTADRSGSTVVFAAATTDFTHPAGQQTVADLFRWDQETDGVVRVTKGEHLRQPALSSDGGTLLAVKRNGSYADLVEVDLQNGGTTVLFQEPQSAVYTPAISPDGSRVAFAVNRRGVQDIVVGQIAALRSEGSDAAAELFPTDVAGDYFPRWRDNDTLLFGSDRDGYLAVYEVAAGGFRPEPPKTPVVQDRVAAFGAVAHDGETVYASYTSSGYAVKAAVSPPVAVDAPPAARGSGSAADVGPASSLEATNEGGAIRPTFGWEAVPPSRPYVDLPRFVAWAPFPAFTATVDANLQRGIAFGPGVFAMGASALRTVSWNGGVGYYPGLGHPYVFANVDLGVGSVSLSYSVTHDYSEAVTVEGRSHRQLTSQSLSASVPLVARSGFATSTSLAVRLGLVHRLYQSNAAPFTFVESFAGGAVANDHDLLPEAGLSFVVAGRRASADMRTPGFSSGIGAQFPVPLDVGDPTGVAGSSIAAYTLRTAVPTLFVRGALRGSFLTPSLAGTWRHGLSPRGMLFASEIFADRYELGFLGSIDAFGTLFVADLPLVLGQSLQHVGMGAYVEAEAGVSVTGDVGVGRYLYPGVELEASLGSSALGIPLVFGVAFRVDATNPAAFSPQNDISPYVRIGIDSLSGVVGPSR